MNDLVFAKICSALVNIGLQVYSTQVSRRLVVENKDHELNVVECIESDGYYDDCVTFYWSDEIKKWAKFFAVYSPKLDCVYLVPTYELLTNRVKLVVDRFKDIRYGSSAILKASIYLLSKGETDGDDRGN